MVILSVTAVPLSMLMIQHVEGVVLSTQLDEAMNLARREAAVLRNRTYDAITEGVSVSPGYQGSDYDVETSVSKIWYGPESLAEIHVRTLKTGTSDVVASLVFYRSRNISYGI